MKRSGSIHHDGEWWHPTPDGNWLKWDALSDSWVPSAGPPREALEAGTTTEVSAEEVVYAGFWKRFGAAVIDALVLGVAQIPVIMSISVLFGESGEATRDPESLQSITNAVNLVVGWLYFAGLESSSKQATLGKQALGIRVTDLNGNRISFGRATGRYFAKIVSAVIFLIGFIMAAFTSKRQALHDMIADCLVVAGKAGALPPRPAP